MPFIRPVVEVFQEFDDVVVSPAAPDLNCCLVGPAYYIQDYPTDKTDIYVSDYVKSGYTADAASSAADGSSEGRPDPGDFVTLSDPPNHIAGGVLDSASVQVIYDDVYIELDHQIDGAIAANENEFTSALADFVTNKVAAGDRIVMTGDGGGGVKTVVKLISEVTDANTLKLASTNKQGVSGYEDQWIGTSSIRWRVEHALDDQEIDSAYYTIVSQQITITTPGGGILIAYEGLTKPVNYGKIYIGYRELRTDLQDVRELENSDAIEAAIGRVDERNPLAAGAQVTLANTGTPIQVFGVETDDLAGHTSARDNMTTREDIYAIVPLTDSLSGSDWINVIGMWKAHVELFDDPDRSKFRVVLGSYDVLPTDKSSAPPSLVGSTKPASPSTDPYDVFIDPAATTEFVTKGVTSSHLLDVQHAGVGDLDTLSAGDHIFNSGYGGAKTLRGAMGGKRIRTTDADKFTSGHAGQQCAYTVREAILKSEGGTEIAADTSVALTTDGGDLQLTAATANAFANVAVGDVVHIRGVTVTTAYNGGWLVKTKTDSNNITVDTAYSADDTAPNVEVYRPDAFAADAATATGPNKITATGKFADAAPGDIIYILQDTANAANEGMWIVVNKVDNDNVLVSGGSSNLDVGSTADIALFANSKQANGDATVTVRQRLTRLEDNTASFTTTVTPGELIEIPYPEEVDPTKWDTATTTWPIDTVVDDNRLDADLEDLEELAPKVFTAEFSGDCPYRVAITLNKASQVDELNATISSLAFRRLVMVWPNEVYVSSLDNALTGVQSKQTGQYLACAVGGMVAGLPSHQGFTFLGIAGIQQLFNSNFYFTDDQLTELRDGGWYVFVQDSETSLPYTIHEVTTDVSAYAFGEFMNIKNFDYISTYFKTILQEFLGEYNINNQTLEMIRASLNAGAEFLRLRIFPKIGVPLLGHEITELKQSETEVDRVEVRMTLDLPKVLNQIGLYLRA